MGCSDRYDLTITDGDGESHGLLCDWERGGAGLSVEKAARISNSTATSTKGDYGVRDVEDHWRIIQSDWSEGSGQKTYDRDKDSESAFDSSFAVDVSHEGELRLGPNGYNAPDSERVSGTITIPSVIAAFDDTGVPTIYGAFSSTKNPADPEERVAWSTDAITWNDLDDDGPGADVTSMVTDGRYIYVAAGGVPYRGSSDGFIVMTGSNITHLACSAGYLYGAKGSDSSDAQLGYFDGSNEWQDLSPIIGSAINLRGATFGLVSSGGSLVYWGVTNGQVSTLYRARWAGSSETLVFQSVCTFPVGFVGKCLYSYLGTIYVGGGYSGATTGQGIGAIYAVLDGSPMLLTDVGDDPVLDNHVVAMTSYGKALYFLTMTQPSGGKGGSIWRWDLVRGGLSHLYSPLSMASTMTYDGIDWVGHYPFNTEFSDESLPKLKAKSPDKVGVYTAQFITEGYLRMRPGREANARIRYVVRPDSAAGRTDALSGATGITTEVEVPAGYISTYNVAFCLGIQSESESVFVSVDKVSQGGTAFQRIDLYSGPRRGLRKLLGSCRAPMTAGRLRLTLKDKTMRVYWNGELLAEAEAPTKAPEDAKTIWWEAYKLKATKQAESVTINDLRWSDEGVYDTDSGGFSSVTGIDLAAAQDNLFAACTAAGYTVVLGGTYRVAGADDEQSWLLSSQTSGNMPTVDKYVVAIHVAHKPLPDDCSIGCAIVADGALVMLERDEAASTETKSVFPVGLTMRSMQYKLFLSSESEMTTPRITEVAILFDPAPKTAHVHTYFVRCWQNVEDRLGGHWDEDSMEVFEWLEKTASTIVTVERPGLPAYSGRLEELTRMEAPPSARPTGYEGLFQLQVRKMD